MNEIPSQLARTLTRRQLFQNAGAGIGGMALASLFEKDGFASNSASSGILGSEGLHFPPTAKNVIYVHMVGAPSHLDLFDYKPELQKRSGELCPDYMFKGKQLAFIREQPTLMGTPGGDQFAFNAAGNPGLPFPTFYRTSRLAQTTCASFAPCTQINLITPRHKCSC